MQILKAKPVTESILKDVNERTKAFQKEFGRQPMLAVVLVGKDPASVIYTTKKGQMATSLGMKHITIELPENSSPSQVRSRVKELNDDPHVDGILIQRPLPKGFKEEEVVFWVDPAKDVDAFHPLNTGKLVLGLPCFQPCTPSGIMELLRYYKFDLAGKTACVIGRSSIVGKPMATMLLQANATVFHCHSHTKNLKDISSTADILIVAAGKSELVDKSFVKQGAIVIDVGMHRLPDGKLTGDVKFEEVSKVASAITPVPGGVGPMTIAILMKNTVLAAEQRSR